MHQHIENSSVEAQLIVAEFKSLRDEIATRMNRIAHLQELLLIGLLAYGVTVFAPNANSVSPTNGSFPTISPLATLMYLFISMLPFIAFSAEAICSAEMDAVYRAATFIRHNIERQFRSTPFRGWEDWLGRQDRFARLRASDHLAELTRRFVIFIYCVASSVFGMPGLLSTLRLSNKYTIHWSLILYLGLFLLLLFMLRRSQQKNLSNSEYEVCIVDIDGCLTDSNGLISAPNRSSLHIASQRGVHIMLASGRGPEAVRLLAQDLCLLGPHVACHGAVTVHLSPDGYKTIGHFSESETMSILNELHRYKIKHAVFTCGDVWIGPIEPESVEEDLRFRRDVSPSESLKPITTSTKINAALKILCFLPSIERSKENAMRLHFSNNALIIRSTPETIELLPSGVSKVGACKKLLEPRFRDGSNVLALGDYDNDIDILTWARHGVAPANASIRVRGLQGIDILSVTNDQDFVNEALTTYITTRRN